MLYAVYRGISDINKIKCIFLERQIPEDYFELFRTPNNALSNPLLFLVSKSVLNGNWKVPWLAVSPLLCGYRSLLKFNTPGKYKKTRISSDFASL